MNSDEGRTFRTACIRLRRVYVLVLFGVAEVMNVHSFKLNDYLSSLVRFRKLSSQSEKPLAQPHVSRCRSYQLMLLSYSSSSLWTLPSLAAGSHLSSGVTKYVTMPRIVMPAKITGEKLKLLTVTGK